MKWSSISFELIQLISTFDDLKKRFEEKFNQTNFLAIIRFVSVIKLWPNFIVYKLSEVQLKLRISKDKTKGLVIRDCLKVRIFQDAERFASFGFSKRSTKTARMEFRQRRPQSVASSLAILWGFPVLLSSASRYHLLLSDGCVDCWKWNCRLDLLNVSYLLWLEFR